MSTPRDDFRPARLSYELVFLSGARAGVVVPVRGTLLAGRDAECSLEVPDPRVSRTHAQVTFDGVNVTLTDANSSNGTFLNEHPVTQAQMRHGDILRLGTTRLRLRQRRNGAGDRTAVFGLADAREPQTSHTVSVTQLREQSTSKSPEVLQRRVQSLMRVAEVLARERTVDELSDPVLEVLLGLFPQTHRGFLLLGSDAETLQPQAMRSRDRGDRAALAVSRSICRAALDKRAALIYREGGDEPIDAGHSVADLNIRSALAVPLLVADEIVGLVVLDTRSAARPYDQDDLEMAAAIGQQVAIAIRNAQLLEEVAAQTAVRNNLMRFLPEAMTDRVLAGEIDGGLGGRRHHGTILFSDLIGFTALAERMGPEELVNFMNGYFNRMVPTVEREGGSIDKFMGDAIMAVWGIPTDDDESALRAAAAALTMQIQLAAYHSEVDRPLPMGIGLNTGEMVAGNIGAGNRREYTVLGDSVNTAQRIGAVACTDQVLISASTWQALNERGFGVRMPPLEVKNRREPVQCYSLRALAMEHDEVLMFVPVRAGDATGYLIRRLADGAFILLHPPDLQGALRLHAVELGATDLGAPTATTALSPQPEDGRLRRSVVRLADTTLGGVLAPAPATCERAWTEMRRAATTG